MAEEAAGGIRMKWPFLKFYTRDWQSDFELRMCSLEARGFWFECLCIMHNAKRRGFMETPQGVPLDDHQTARLIGTSKGDVKRLRLELMEHGVASIDDDSGLMYCRRMVKDTIKAEKCSAAGKKNGGSPLLRKNKDTRILETRNHISLEVTFKGQAFDVDSAFEEFWKAYPKRGSANPKKPAKAKFIQAIKNGATMDEVMAGVKNLNEHHIAFGSAGTSFVPMAQTWLNQARWTDVLDTKPPVDKTSPRHKDVCKSQNPEDFIL